MSFRRKIVAGNWKMNLTYSEAIELTDGILSHLDQRTTTEVIICPPFPFIQPIHAHLKGLHKVKLGAQNCSENFSGAFTGDVSAAMLKSVNCEYLIIGHSERRTFYNENNTQLTEKIKRALENELAVIFCIGEKLEERKNDQHFQVVQQQIKDVLGNFKAEELEHLIIAYEPVWAIGTGLTATAAQAQEMHAHIRKTLAELFSERISERTPLLYGGSCNASNAQELFACADVDGGLIGGASLKAQEFCKIIASF